MKAKKFKNPWYDCLQGQHLGASEKTIAKLVRRRTCRYRSKNKPGLPNLWVQGIEREKKKRKHWLVHV